MKNGSQPLTKQNYIALGMLIAFLVIGIIGGFFQQKWAENIYTFWSSFVMIVFILLTIMKARVKPMKPLVVMYTINLFVSVALGWWWLVLYWIATHILCFCGMYQWDLKYKSETDKEPVK
ncbi:MAG TPA: hypothetical protein VMX17_13915 [Candidatus Glassbacteria bacterium]|nr:hypothetical protein [Candidatus Glassbacteria bacterium]